MVHYHGSSLQRAALFSHDFVRPHESHVEKQIIRAFESVKIPSIVQWRGAMMMGLLPSSSTTL